MRKIGRVVKIELFYVFNRNLLSHLFPTKTIYVFDEATSNIDIDSEAIIMKNIKAISEEKSAISR